MEIKITIKDGVTKKLKDAEKKLPQALMRAMEDTLGIIETQAKMNVTTGGVSGLHVRTGHLRRSITHEGPKKQGNRIIGKIGATAPYAPVHEFGATITPKKTKFLAIPLGPAKTAAGAARAPGPRHYSNTFIRKSKAGKLIIFQKLGKKRIIPLFVLVKRVVVPKRPWLLPAINKSVPRIMKAIMRRIDQVFK